MNNMPYFNVCVCVCDDVRKKEKKEHGKEQSKQTINCAFGLYMLQIQRTKNLRVDKGKF